MYTQTARPAGHQRRPLTVGRVILLLFLLLIALAFWYVARSGLVPGLARLVGADKLRNLGVS